MAGEMTIATKVRPIRRSCIGVCSFCGARLCSPGLIHTMIMTQVTRLLNSTMRLFQVRTVLLLCSTKVVWRNWDSERNCRKGRGRGYQRKECGNRRMENSGGDFGSCFGRERYCLEAEIGGGIGAFAGWIELAGWSGRDVRAANLTNQAC